MSDIFESTAKKYRGSPAAVVLFVLALAMLFIGLNHFIEDTYSSKYGLVSLQTSYKMNVQIFDWTYWTMSLAPQVATMVFFYLYLSDTSRKSFLLLSGGAQVMDFIADAWYRSDGKLFGSWEVLLVSGFLTFVYFTIGSELFVTVGAGVVLKLAPPAVQTLRMSLSNLWKALNMEYRPDGQEKKDKQETQEGQHRRSEDNNGHKKHITPEMMEKIRQNQKNQPIFHQVKGNFRENRGNSDKSPR